MSKLDEILGSFSDYCGALERYENTNGLLSRAEAKTKILALFRGLLPEKRENAVNDPEWYQHYCKAHNSCLDTIESKLKELQ